MRGGSYDARAVANALLDIAREYSIELTNLQLQKVVFFAHGMHLQAFGHGLVMNRFEAWDHGPVVPELYRALKRYGDQAINSDVQHFDLEAGRAVKIQANFPRHTIDLLREAVLFYGRMQPWALVALSHSADGPWHKTRAAAESHVNFSMVIESRVIEEFFLSRLPRVLQ